MVALMLTFSCFLNGVCRHEPKIKENAEYATGKKDAETTVVGSQAASVTTAFDPNIECRKGVNVERPECIAWFDGLSKSGASVQSNESNAFVVSYNPNQPYDVDLSNVPLQIVDYPRLTGCAKKPTGELVGIDQQGNIMPNLDKNACLKWLNGERLFDYTKQPTQVNNNAPVPNQTNNTQPSEPSIQELAKIEQAKIEGLI